jgi:hypothetical protein
VIRAVIERAEIRDAETSFKVSNYLDHSCAVALGEKTATIFMEK